MIHIITKACDTLRDGTLLIRIPKPLVFGKCFDSIYISELVSLWFTYAHFHNGDKERNYDAEGIRGELERSRIEVLKHRLDKNVKGKSGSSS